MAQEQTDRRRIGWMRGILLGVLAMVALLATTVTFLVATSPGGRVSLALAEGFLPDDLEFEAEKFAGRLIDRFELEGVTFRIPTLELKARRVTLDWSALGLLAKRIDVRVADVEGASVTALTSAPDSAPQAAAAPPDSAAVPPGAKLPFEVRFDSVHVSDVTYRMHDTLWVSGGAATLSGSLEEYRLSFQGEVAVPGLTTAEVRLGGSGSTSGFDSDNLEVRTLDGTISGSAAVTWWPELSWVALLEARSLAPAPLLPDPDEWPGRLSFALRTEGRIVEGRPEIGAVLDTVSGDLRGERIAGRLDALVRGDEIDVRAARISWGPASVRVSGSAAQSLDLEFEAAVPNLDLMVPGASGRVVASGRATGPREAPRVQADVAADSVTMDAVAVARATGRVDLDMAGNVRADLKARRLSISGLTLDSATVVLTGLAERHRVRVSVRGPDAELDLSATGGLDPAGVWKGTVTALRVSADRLNTWTLTDPVNLTASTAAVELGEACFESPPARICAAGTLNERFTRIAVTADSVEVARFQPLLPEGLSVEAILGATANLEIASSGRLTGSVDVRTGPGRATLVTDGGTRILVFEPIVFAATSGPEGVRSEFELHVADSARTPLLDVSGRMESAVPVQSVEDLARLSGQPLSVRLEANVDEMAILAARLIPDLNLSGSLRALVHAEVGEDGRLEGTADITSGPGAIAFQVDGETRSLAFEPLTLSAAVGSDGVRGELDLHLADSTGARVLDVTGRYDSPVAIVSLANLTRLAVQPMAVHLEVQADDLGPLVASTTRNLRAVGGFGLVLDAAVDAQGNLEGTLTAGADSLTLTNTARGRARTVTVEPLSVRATVGPYGLSGDLAASVSAPDEELLLQATGRLSLPELTGLKFDPESQPIDGRLDVEVSDMSIVEALLMELSDASGTFELHTRVAGTLSDVTVDGEATLSDGRVLVPSLGLNLTGIQFAAIGRPNGEVQIDGQIQSGSGQVTIRGRSERFPSADNPTLIQVRGERFQVMDIPEVRIEANPALDVLFDGSTLQLNGHVDIPRARIGLPEIPPAAVIPSDDVIIVGDTAIAPEPPVPFGADLNVALGEDVFFNGFGLTGNLVGELRITQRPGGQPGARGELRLVNGTYRQIGQELRIDPGRLIFNGPIDDPGVDARAFVRASDQTEAGFEIRGTVQNLDVSTYSVPPKPESDIMAYILFGRPMNQTTGTEGAQASNAAAVLGANMLAMSLAPSLGLDEARIDTGSQRNKAQLVVGKYLSPRLYVGYGVGIYEPISTIRLRYLLSARWSIETITGDQQSTDLLWRIERGGPKVEMPQEDADADEPSSGISPARR